MVKPNLGIHAGRVDNPKSFDEVYQHIVNNPDIIYYTIPGRVPFKAKATFAKRGNHAGEPVIRFFSRDTEMARAYRCCWGHITNCNKTHIDVYTKAIK